MSQETIPVNSSDNALNLFAFLSVCFVLGLGLYFGISELRYFIFGATTVAKINRESYEFRSEGGRRAIGGGSNSRVAELDYSFQEKSGWIRMESAEINCKSLTIGPDKTVQVQYIPGVKNASRVKNTRSLYSYAWSFLIDVLLLLGSVIVVGSLWGIWYILHSVWTRVKRYSSNG